MGFFSWNTADTGKPVRNEWTDNPSACRILRPGEPDFIVPKGGYDGYGRFTDRQGNTLEFYSEVDRLNGGDGSDRDRGIRLSLAVESGELDASEVIQPRIVSYRFKGKWADVGDNTSARCQGYFDW